MFLELLPELQRKVFQYLHVEDLKSLARTCMELNEMLKEYIWQVVRITYMQLLDNEFSKNQKLEMLKYTKTLYIVNNFNEDEDYTDYGDYSEYADEDEVDVAACYKRIEAQLCSNYNLLLDYCNPKVLHFQCHYLMSRDGFPGINKLENLQELYLYGTEIFDSHITSVCNNCTSKLKVLNIQCEYVSDIALEDINKLMSLEEFNLSYCFRVTDLGLSYISSLTNLKKLHWAQITDKGLRHICKLSLKELNVANCHVTDSAMPYICSMETLERLILYGTDVGNRGVKRLINLTHLKELDLGDNLNLTDESFWYLGQLTSLEKLFLSRCNVTDENLHSIGELFSLQYLNVKKNPITDEGLNALSTLHHLIELNISECNVTDDGMSYLASLPSLKKLRVSYNNVSDDCISYLQSLKTLTIIKEHPIIDIL